MVRKLDEELHKLRYCLENLFIKVEQYRGLAVRYNQSFTQQD